MCDSCKLNKLKSLAVSNCSSTFPLHTSSFMIKLFSFERYFITIVSLSEVSLFSRVPNNRRFADGVIFTDGNTPCSWGDSSDVWVKPLWHLMKHIDFVFCFFLTRGHYSSPKQSMKNSSVNQACL